MSDLTGKTQKPAAAEATQAPAQGKGGASLTSIAWVQFRKHPLARASLAILGVLYLVAAFADFIAPYPERFIDTTKTFHPPSQIHWRDADGNFTRPYIYAMKKSIDMETFETIWTVDPSQTYELAFFVRREGRRDQYVPFPVNLIPAGLRQDLGIRPWASLHLFGLADPNARANLYLWGSNDLGADVFSKILFGARISLTIGIVSALVSILIGMIMGGLAGYFGGWVDEVIMRLVEALAAIPDLFLLLTLSAVFYPLNLPASTVFFLVVIALSLVGWGGVARTVRGQVLSLREREFAYAAKALGAGNWRVITSHLLPHTLSYVIVQMSLIIPAFIIVESILSFFGLGIQEPSTSWGNMLSTAQAFAGVSGLDERWWIFLPGLFIFIAVITWNLLGDGLRDAFDPRSRK